MTQPLPASLPGATAAAPASRPGIAALGRAPLPPAPLLGFIAAFVAVVMIAFFSQRAIDSSAGTSELVAHTFEVTMQLRSVLGAVKDAETGQRGYILTGAESYLEPYDSARATLNGAVAQARRLLADNPAQLQRLQQLQALADAKLAELADTIRLRRAGDEAGALQVVRSDRGRLVMDRLRELIGQMQAEQARLLQQREADWRHALSFSSSVTWGGSALLLALLTVAAVTSSRDYRAREREGWLRAGLAGLGLELQGEFELEALGRKLLAYLSRLLKAPVGAAYVVSPDGSAQRIAAHALQAGAPQRLAPGEGLVGAALQAAEPVQLSDLPAGYLAITSATGGTDPQAVVVAPALADGELHGAVELGFTRPVDRWQLQLLERASQLLALALRTAKDRAKLQALLAQTQQQAAELQAQQEELRVSNEELEEQGQALRASQAQLEQQQAELEQTNAHLEEQALVLERQKDELTHAQAVLADKADELGRANQVKSEFLANMSHELRTPLNSTLILAKLLADNKGGNLSEEQVKFAQTILSAGNDLLALINDILDLSKIEAGKVEINAEPVGVAGLVDGLLKTLQPQAQHKGLQLLARIGPEAPAAIETDPLRLGQILKNLLSNALKFTERGEVVLEVGAAGPDAVALRVRDTGIGIPAHQQQVIFEAFRQADGSTHRKYGGTGLGLAISRDLARLLGGDIALQSTPGQGSCFTLTLPCRLDGGTAAGMAGGEAPALGRTALPLPPVAANAAANAAVIAAADAGADEQPLPAGGGRTILVIEDDRRFAEILRDVVQEMHFDCLIAASAGEGLALARRRVPSAIVLDMHLPDHSGLGVLDQLKRDPRTRHIPVHVVSVADLSQEALALGAVGYAIKPVPREQLVQALQRLEARLAQSVRRVLVVEDDARQRNAMRELLGSLEVDITDVASAGEALRALQATTFDCMVMDLSLPDFSGYELLDRMAAQEDVAFPPVIVYTARSLSLDEEQRLRRYSRSIIVKDARSPERLLDEVTLFLHQVESALPPESQRLLQVARDRDQAIEGRRVLVVEDDVRNIFALSSVLEPKGAAIEVARNGREALAALERSTRGQAPRIDLVLMDIMMPEMDGLTAMREIRKRPEWRRLPIIALTAKAMRDDQEHCLEAGANDYIAKPLDVEKLLSLVRVWMPK